MEKMREKFIQQTKIIYIKYIVYSAFSLIFMLFLIFGNWMGHVSIFDVLKNINEIIDAGYEPKFEENLVYYAILIGIISSLIVIIFGLTKYILNLINIESAYEKLKAKDIEYTKKGKNKKKLYNNKININGGTMFIIFLFIIKFILVPSADYLSRERFISAYIEGVYKSIELSLLVFVFVIIDIIIIFLVKEDSKKLSEIITAGKRLEENNNN